MFFATTKKIEPDKPWANGFSQSHHAIGSWWVRDSTMLGYAWGITNRDGKFVIGGFAFRQATARERAQSVFARMHGYVRAADGTPVIGKHDFGN